MENEVWVPIAFASPFLNDQEKEYSTNELINLATIWSCEHFRNYLLSNHFEVLTDHKAIFSALKTNRGNKTHQSHLTRWADRLLPFDFDVLHISGSKLGIVGYLSRFPTFEVRLRHMFYKNQFMHDFTAHMRDNSPWWTRHNISGGPNAPRYHSAL